MTDYPGWKYYQTVTPTAAVHSGALTGYQYPIKVVVGSGTAAAYTHQTGIGGSQIYVPAGHCRSDFYDFRFYVGTTLCDHHRISKTDGVQAEFNVELPNDATTPEAIIIRYGNFYATTDTSSAADTYVSAPISGVVGAWALEEADAEVNPTVITAGTDSAFYTPNSWSAGGTIGTPTLSAEDGMVKATTTAGGNNLWNMDSGNFAAKDLSALNKIRLTFKGQNTSKQFYLNIYTAYAGNHYYQYIFTDTSASTRVIDIPYSAFTISNTPSWASITRVIIMPKTANTTGVFYFGRLVADVGVVAVDSSGFGNNGAATGTTIVANPVFTGKNGRGFNGVNSGGDSITGTTSYNATSDQTILMYYKPSDVTEDNAQIFANGAMLIYQSATDGKIYTQFYNGTSNVSITSDVTLSNNTAYLIGCRLNRATGAYSLIVNSTIKNASVTVGTGPADGNFGFCIGATKPACVISNGIVTTELVSDAVIASLAVGQNVYPDVGLVVGSVCPRKYAATTNPTHDTATSEVASTSGDEQYYYYNEYFTLTPEQEAKLSPQQKQRRAQHEATLHPTAAKLSRVDWSNQATESHILDLSSSRILEEAKQLGLIKKRN